MRSPFQKQGHFNQVLQKKEIHELVKDLMEKRKSSHETHSVEPKEKGIYKQVKEVKGFSNRPKWFTT